MQRTVIHLLRYFLTALTVMCAAIYATSQTSANTKMPQEDLRTLKAAVTNSSVYANSKRATIDSLKLLLPRSKDEPALFNLYMDIGKEYWLFVADSAIYYFSKALQQAGQIHHEEQINTARIGLLSALGASGNFVEACELLKDMENRPLTSGQRIKLWQAARQLYSSMANYMGEESPYGRAYTARYICYDDSLLSHLPHTTYEWRFIHSERLVAEGHYNEAKKELNSLLAELPQENNIYGKAAYQMALVYRNQGDETRFASYMAKAALSDVKGNVSDGWALPMLADWLYQHGQLDDAFLYINHSLAEAQEGNVRMRTSTIAAMMPAIDRAYRESLNKSHDRMVLYLCMVAFLCVIAVGLIMVLHKQIQTANRSKRKLAKTSRILENYLGNFVALCSSYASKLDSWQKMVVQKLTTGQGDDLLKAIKSGRLAAENTDFHSAIDKAFLDLYPDFVDRINDLLRDDEQIVVRKPGVLPAEIRIYALLRLGVKETARIASILQYSTNTVYAYRNKMRGKALQRDTFEQDVLTIARPVE